MHAHLSAQKINRAAMNCGDFTAKDWKKAKPLS